MLVMTNAMGYHRHHYCHLFHHKHHHFVFEIVNNMVMINMMHHLHCHLVYYFENEMQDEPSPITTIITFTIIVTISFSK